MELETILDMIEFKRDAYIVGIWYANRIKFGKVYIYALKGKADNEWIGHIKYIYHNDNINLYLDHDSHFNLFLHKGITEEDMMKICKDRIDELHCIFNHKSDKLIVNGNFEKLEKLRENKGWLPDMRQEPVVKISSYVRKPVTKN